MGFVAVAGFASAWMLLWAAAASIPIVLHLLNRRRQQTVSWAAMQLLLQVIEKQSKRIRVEQLLLLILRSLILIVFALALARPYFTPSLGDGVTNLPSSTFKIIVLDTSYSMGYREQQQTRFTIARNRAMELVRQAGEGHAFAVVTLGQPSQAIVSRASFDADAVIGAISKIKLQAGGGDLEAALSKIQDLIQQASNIQEIPQEVEIVFLSDFGRDTWADATSGSLQRLLSELAQKHRVVYDSLASGIPENVAITSMKSQKTRGIRDQSMLVELAVANFSPKSLVQLPVQLESNGQTLVSQLVDIPAMGTKLLRMEIKPSQAGAWPLTARIPDDRLMVDNRRDHIVEVREAYRVLCIENPYNDARILKAALQPDTRTRTSLSVSSMSQVEASAADLNSFDAIVLNDLTSISESQFARLSNFVQQGGSLICMFGTHTDAANWNALSAMSSPVLGFQLNNPTEFADLRIDPQDYSSAIVAPFADYPDAGLLTTPVFRVWSIRPADGLDHPLVTELSLQGNRPLVVRHRWGAGNVACLLSAPQTGNSRTDADPWNAMAAWPSFVPLMQQLVQHVLDGYAQDFNRLVGQPLTGTLSPTSTVSGLSVLRPDGQTESIATSASDGKLRWSYSKTDEQGIYQVTQADSLQPHAVNIDPIQSDLSYVAVDLLPKSVAVPQDQLTVRTTSTGGEAASPRREYYWVHIVLAILAVLLVTESVLAWHLGRRLG